MDPDILKCWRAEAKILVVDDEDFLVEIIREKLGLEGFQTEGAGFISKPFSWDDLLKLIKSVMT
jgi:hypothetical protein